MMENIFAYLFFLKKVFGADIGAKIEYAYVNT